MSTTATAPSSSDVLPRVAPPVPSHPLATIPDGVPAAVALAMLASVCPSARTELAGRVAAVQADVDGLVEQARLDTSITLARFLDAVGRKLRLKATLLARLRALDPSMPAADDTPTALRVCQTVRSIRRWRSGSELRAERPRMIAQVVGLAPGGSPLPGQLADVERSLQSLMWTPPGSMVIPANQGHHRAGLVHQHDEWLRRAEALLERRQTLRTQLDRLDPTGDAGRSAMVKEAIDAAGGPSIVAESIRHATREAAELGKAKRAVDAIVGGLAGIDPETERAALLNADLVKAKERLTAAAEASELAKARTAGAIVERALSGTLAGIAELQSYLSADAELAKALDAIRASDTDLVAVVEALMG